MYIHWTHHYLPKTFAFLSYTLNPIFIYLILTDQKTSSIGRYRYLLLFFALFDMTYTTVELLVPVGIHGTGSAFVVCLTDGPFYGPENLRLGQLAVSVRCGCISLSYGILITHFIYRYIALFHPHFVAQVFKPAGMLCILLFFLTHGIVWSTVCELFLYADQEMRDYIREVFLEDYNVSSDEIAFLGALYMEGSDGVKSRSWIGILILTGISIYAVSLYIGLGFKIFIHLRNNPALSPLTQKLHRQLFRALSVQTFIPICISFSPCMVAWYGPVLNLDLGMWNNYLGVIALSAFPFMDPMAIVLLLPGYRSRVFRFLKLSKNQISIAGIVTKSWQRTGTAMYFQH